MARHRMRAPGWYWAAAVAALIWTLIGCYAYLTQVGMDDTQLAALPQAQQDVWRAMPPWATAAYAIAVWSAFAGAVGLLLRWVVAVPLFALSLIGIVVQFGWVFGATDILTTVGPSSTLFPLFIAIVAAVMLWLARTAARRGWIV
jgi:hypothetical protein